MYFHRQKNSQPNGTIEVGKTSTQLSISSGSSFIESRRLLSIVWHPKIDNEQSRVLGGGGGVEVYVAGDRDRVTVRPCKSVLLSAKKSAQNKW